MPSLDELEQEVSDLNKVESNDFRFMDALDHIETAANTTDAGIDRLRDILDRYRAKLPNRETLNADRVRARDLAETLMLTTLSQRLDRIKARNETLSTLTSTLQTQIAKANNDANLLKQIKEAVDKATKTVGEIKSIINQLSATDTTVKEKLVGLVEGLGDISTIFSPQNA
jgi:septation ring formation regulator EzrA